MIRFYVGLFSILIGVSSYGLDDPSLLSSQLQKTLKEKIPSAEIHLPNLDKLAKTAEVSALKTIASVRLTEDRAVGVAVFEIADAEGNSTRVQTPYQAWVKVPVATHRIYPNTKLKKEDFRIDTINVATGPARDYRGVLISADANLDRMESKQTILENQFVVITAVQKQPDLRKGETVKLELNSGDLVLSTAAVAQESASIGEKIHVLTAKSKKDIVGKVRDEHTVEVSL